MYPTPTPRQPGCPRNRIRRADSPAARGQGPRAASSLPCLPSLAGGRAGARRDMRQLQSCPPGPQQALVLQKHSAASGALGSPGFPPSGICLPGCPRRGEATVGSLQAQVQAPPPGNWREASSSGWGGGRGGGSGWRPRDCKGPQA